MAGQAKLPIAINRDAPPIPSFPFTDYFQGFERVGAVREVFGDDTDRVLKRLRVGFVSNKYMYMGVSDQDGNLRVGTFHLANSDLRTLYLDIVHELYHVRQFRKDKAWFGREHRKYLKDGFNTRLYFSSPLEVPAYRHAVDEAKRIGMDYREIAEYLKMGPVEPDVFARLLKDVDLDRRHRARPPVKLKVKINRVAKVPLFSFTDYFSGFEKLASVKALFGASTRHVLDGLKIEFTAMSMAMVYPNEDDGHLVIGVPYFRKGDARLIYMDVLMCLNMLARSEKAGSHRGSGDREAEQEGMMIQSLVAAVKLGREAGLTDDELRPHLNFTRFMLSSKNFRKLLSVTGLTAQRAKLKP